VLTFHGSPYHNESPLHPVVSRLERGLTIPPGSSTKSITHTIDAWLSEQGLDPREHAPSFHALLAPEDYRADDPDRLKRRIFDSLGAWLVHGQRKPALLVFEDAHWLDPSTVELIGELVERIRDHAIFLLVTHRPGFSAPWSRPSHQLNYSLGGLSRRQVGSLAKLAAGAAMLPQEVLDRIASRADGLPLFAEELTHAVVEAGESNESVDLTDEAVPFTLKDSLTARLDRLGDAKRVAQDASILGRGFTSSVLRAIGERDPNETETHLATLVRSGLVLRDRSRGEDAYLFKHALVRDTAYESMLRSRRREVHACVVSVLESVDAERARRHPDVLAHHVEQAGDTARALDLWCAAGQRSLEGSHYVETIGSYRRALVTLQSWIPSPERDARELEVRVALIAPLVAAYGYGASAVAENATRALALCDSLGDDDRRFVAWYARWVNLRVRGKTRELLGVTEQVRTHPAATALEHQALALRMQGQALFDLGRPHEAIPLLRECLELLHTSGERSFVYGTEPIVQCQFYLALCSWLTGAPATAKRLGNEVVRDAEQLGHPNTLAVCLGHIGFMLNALTKDWASLRVSMRRLRTIADEKSLSQWQGVSRFGLALCMDDPAESVAAMEAALVQLGRIDVRVWRPVMLAWLAERLTALDAERALRAIEEAKALVAEDGESWSDAEVLRIEASVLRAIGRTPEARQRLKDAAIAAHDAGNHCWKLRCLRDKAESEGGPRPSDEELASCFVDLC